MAWRYLKANKGTEGPSSFVVVDTETNREPIPGMPGRFLHTLRLGHAISWRMEGGKQTRRKELAFASHRAFWDFVDWHMSEHRPLWLFAHNLGFDLTVLRFWEELEREAFTLTLYVDETPPTVVSCRRGGEKLVCVDTLNYWRTTLASIGKSVGLDKQAVDFRCVTDRQLSTYCQRDARILEEAVKGLCEFIRGNDLGTMRTTGPAQAMQAFRHRFAPRKRVERIRLQKDGTHKSEVVTVCLPVFHDNTEVKGLERSAYFGGECRCFWLGNILPFSGSYDMAGYAEKVRNTPHKFGPVYHLDVNSLFPSVMAGKHYPCRLLKHDTPAGPGELRLWLSACECVATVRINSPSETFPVRLEGKAAYVCGTFWTTLCGDELRYAMSKGYVVDCGPTAIYETADLFTAFVSFFWDKRLCYLQAKDSAGDSLCKLLLNGLYGKFGRKQYRWVDRPKVASEEPWGPWYETDLEGKEVRVFRSIAWHTQEQTNQGEANDSFTAISACVTANARQRMREYRHVCGSGCVYYQDTDSLHVDKTAYLALQAAGHIHSSQLGKLRLVETIGEARYYGLRDYAKNGHAVTSGRKQSAIDDGERGYSQPEFANLATITAAQPPAGVVERKASYHRTDNTVYGTVDHLGYVHPLKLGG